MYITLENLRNMAKSIKNLASLNHVSPRNNITDYERQQERIIEENNMRLQQLGIPQIRTSISVRGDHEQVQMHKRQDTEGNDGYMPSEDDEPDEEPRAAKKLTMRRSVSETGMVGTRVACRKSNNSFSPVVVI